MEYWFINILEHNRLSLQNSGSDKWHSYWLGQFSGHQNSGILKKVRTYGQNINQVMVF